MTANIQRTQAQTLCKLAADDFSVLNLPLPEAIYGFHAQLCCEKYLKALISATGHSFPHTHKLEQLFDLAVDHGEIFPSLPFGLLQLEPFAVEFRYYPKGSLSENDRPSLIASLQLLASFVTRRVQELEAATA